MDLTKWLSSLDEFLFEVMSWLVFFPLTLWRTLTRPLAMMEYADAQLALPESEQYADAVSPPLFLALALLIAHGVSSALGESDRIIANHHGLAALVNDDTTALVLRVVVFALFPLVMALRLVRRRGQPIDRATLRLPFYAQCYPAAVFAFALSMGVTLRGVPGSMTQIAGSVLAILAFVYFVSVEARWFATRLDVPIVRGLGAALMGLSEGFALMLLVGFLFTR